MSDRIRSAEVARLTSLTARAVQDMAAQGRIPGAAKEDGVWLFERQEVLDWIDDQSTPDWSWTIRKMVEAVGHHEPSERVYFIADGKEAVKIGWSKRPKIRFARLQASTYRTLKLLGFVPGGEALERAIHARFHVNRLNGEWFELSRDVQSFVAQILDRGAHAR